MALSIVYHPFLAHPRVRAHVGGATFETFRDFDAAPLQGRSILGFVAVTARTNPSY
jgi:hypothetical protein